MAASSSSFIPTPLAHADTLGEGPPRVAPLQNWSEAFQLIRTKPVPVAKPTMCLNKEIVQPVSHTQTAFERCYLVKSCFKASHQPMYQHVSDYVKGRIEAYWNCGVSYCNTGLGIGRDPITHQNGRIRVWWHRGEYTLTACIRQHHHTDSSPGMIVWSAIGYMSLSTLAVIDGILNSACYVSGVLRPVDLPFFRALQNLSPE
ncbi:uncharacterized protein TNCV_854491 [Trichonephila clavipes]|nr:uncharacterized protein TNCV_854491 [Trichonephila clavipes]